MSRRVLAPDQLADSRKLDYSQGIVADGTLFVSGQVGWDDQFDLAGDDIVAQAEQAYENVENLLAEAGAETSDVAKVTTYMVEPDDHLEDYHTVWADRFEEPYPCHTVVGVASLAQPEWLVELEVQVPGVDGEQVE